jgi:NAD(P)-dependent dehydrogenase (short-subunit alcohol dehydrogenase family)
LLALGFLSEQTIGSTLTTKVAGGIKMKKVILITGSASGIGAATANLAAEQGHIVYASMRDPSGRNHLAAARLAEHCRVIELDVCEDISVQEAVAKVLADCGRIDVVVNNAGWAIRGAMEEVSITRLQQEFDTNFFGAMRVSQAVAPQMRSQKSGTIVQMSSISGLVVTPLFGAYQSSKWALEAASEAMAFELAHFGVRVLLIEPGNVDTDVVIEQTKALKEGSSAYMALLEQLQRSSSNSAPMLSAAEVAKTVIAAIENEQTPLRTIIGDTAQTVAHRQRFTTAEYWDWFKDTRKLEW